MSIRKIYFNNSWYPGTESEILEQFAEWDKEITIPNQKSTSVIVPHAGWYYSGQLAYEAISTLNTSVDTVVVCGGHLGKGSDFIIPDADAWETPLGHLKVNTSLLKAVKNKFPYSDDNMKDNTIEIQLPIVKHFFPSAKILPLRLSADNSSVEFAEFLSSVKEKICVIGSTDFSHYGPNYNYLKYGLGKKAEDIIRNKIDKILIEHLISCDTGKSLEWCEVTRSACSIGAAICAAEYAKLKNKTGHLIRYYLSSEIIRDSSFVGYAGIYYK